MNCLGMALRWVALILTLFSMAGCQSTPEKNDPVIALDPVFSLLPDDASTPDQGTSADVQKVLMDRGLYLSISKDLRFLNPNYCPMEMVAHRGHPDAPESSRAAIILAGAAGFDAVEIDLMRLRDGLWVNHHDTRSGRATVHVSGKTINLEQARTEDFAGLLTRHKPSGELLNQRPRTALESFEDFAQSRGPGKKLMVELKSEANGRELKSMLDTLTSLVGDDFQFSSLNETNLSRLRGIDPDVPLIFIHRPHPESVDQVARVIKAGARNDPLYQEREFWVEALGPWGLKDYRSRFKDRTSSSSLKKIAQALGGNTSIAVDVRHLKKDPGLLKRARSVGFRVYVYTINSAEYLEEAVASLSPSARPDGVIADSIPYRFCSRVVGPTQPAGNYTPVTEEGMFIASLPGDADLSRLQEQKTYLASNSYLDIHGQVRSLVKTSGTVPATRPESYQGPAILPEVKDVEIRDARKKPLEIQLR